MNNNNNYGANDGDENIRLPDSVISERLIDNMISNDSSDIELRLAIEVSMRDQFINSRNGNTTNTLADMSNNILNIVENNVTDDTLFDEQIRLAIEISDKCYQEYLDNVEKIKLLEEESEKIKLLEEESEKIKLLEEESEKIKRKE